MFDMSVSELAVIGAVALIVIGPEKLPKVARTAGMLLGRMQRYVRNVKADINREMDLANLREIETEMRAAGQQLLHEAKEGLEPVMAESPHALVDATTGPNAEHAASHSQEMLSDANAATQPVVANQLDLFSQTEAAPSPSPASPRDRR